MTKKNRTSDQVQKEAVDLKNRLVETEETLHAIRQYLVDAFVVHHEDGTQVVTIGEADFPYRRMVESMNEGAVTLIPDGTIFYCNERFAEMVEAEPQKLIGVQFQDLVSSEEQQVFETFLLEGPAQGARGPFAMKTTEGKLLPVQLSIFRLGNETSGIAILATDMTERAESEAKIRSLASKLTMAEQEERHRISQILHDDLQQRLFAVKAQLTLMREIVGNNTTASAMHEDVDLMQDWLSEAISITRNLSIDLSPAVLHGESLREGIFWLAGQMQKQYGFQLDFEAPADLIHFDQQTRLMLFQAVRELLFNVVKHAEISRAAVTLERVDQYARITIQDQGQGFDVETVMNDPKAAHGLVFIQNRLGLMGASLQVTSKPGDGTIVVIETRLGSQQ